jgi:hypothetical protein
MRRYLFVALLACGCAAAHATPAPPLPGPDDEQLTASEEDFMARLAERMRQPKHDTPTVMNGLERLLPQWHARQRVKEEAPIENLLTIEVVSQFDQVLDTFQSGGRERRLVAAWALGFSRVPENTLGIDSPHPRAIAALVGALGRDDDQLLRNALLALWKLGDPSTPTAPLLDMMTRHHDPEVRANAALALGTVLSPASAARVTDELLVALSDTEPRVRLHAAGIARRFPNAVCTTRLMQLLPTEQWPYVRAAMAAALGAARSSGAAAELVAMLGSPRAVEVGAARLALTQIFGVDRGPDPSAWSDLLR